MERCRELKDLIKKTVGGQIEILKEKRVKEIKLWKEKGVVVFGAKEMAMQKVKPILERFGVRILCFCDNDSSRFGSIEGHDNEMIEVCAPKETVETFRDSLWLIATGAQHHDSIVTQLIELGVSKDKLYYNWHLDFYLESTEMLLSEEKPFEKSVAELLDYYNDLTSIQIIWCHLMLLYSFENVPECLKEVTLERLCEKPQYFLGNGKYLKEKTMIDCGAYIGDTLDDLINTIGYYDFDEYHCFEMDLETYDRLNSYVQSLDAGVKKRVFTHNMGVWNMPTKLRYYKNSIGGSSIGGEGDEEVELVRIDDMFSDSNVSFIKMDIEGSERFALLGCEEIIKKCKPTCAICVYHSVEDLWLIPSILKRINPDYNLILRHHTTYWDDSVCYARMGEWR